MGAFQARRQITFETCFAILCPNRFHQRHHFPNLGTPRRQVAKQGIAMRDQHLPVGEIEMINFGNSGIVIATQKVGSDSSVGEQFFQRI